MPAICLYFQLHQPYRLRSYDFTSIGTESEYFNQKMNTAILDWMADKCYLPALSSMLSMAKQAGGNFKVSFSASGTALEQLKLHRPDVIEAFSKLQATGCVEWVGETYYHSLASLYSWAEFERQVHMQRELLLELFGAQPIIFRNT